MALAISASADKVKFVGDGTIYYTRLLLRYKDYLLTE